MKATGGQIQGVRDDQEDCWHLEAFGASEVLAVVADGLGGHPAGDVASVEGVEEFVRQFRRHRRDAALTPRQWLENAIAAADEHLHERQRADPKLRGMATTMVAFYAHGDAFWAASIGDSYLLLQRRGELMRLNELHSENGGVTSCLGFNLARLDIADRLAVEAGDRFLLATDGIATLQETDLEALLRTAGDPAGAVREILLAIEASAHPYQDNATVVAVFV